MNALHEALGAADAAPIDLGKIRLTPGQAAALAELETMSAVTAGVGLWGFPGTGKTEILRIFTERQGGMFITLQDIIAAFRNAPIEDPDSHILFYLLERFKHTDLLVVDSLEIWSGEFNRSRSQLISRLASIDLLFRFAESTGRRIVVGTRDPQSGHFKRSYVPMVEVPPPGPTDYAAFAATYLGSRADDINFRLVFQQFGSLTGYQLRAICQAASSADELDTDSFVAFVEEMAVRDSLTISEVEPVTFETMPGTEQIARTLETHVVLPLTNAKLADQLSLQAKRGVLLYGPPGTGKTSIGRALAHRLKGRFFLIDGSVKTEPAYAFAGTLQSIAAQAMHNSPSVLFIDDADLLFGIAHAAGLARYLLTLLDGLVSDSASKVCVMMTAMDPQKIPEAVLRSGRVELWLEVKSADERMRAAVLKRWMGDILPGADAIDYARFGAETRGFTPADLRRVANDARSFYAVDRVRGRPAASADDYVEMAVQGLIATRRAMAVNLADPSLRVG